MADEVRLAVLHQLEKVAIASSLGEAVRLLESTRYHELTDAHIHEVANYRAIELGDELFFERAFSSGKEAASALALARELGREVVLEDLRRLASTLGCPRDDSLSATG